MTMKQEEARIAGRVRNDARRKLLKTLVAGGGIVATARLLPEQWTRPVVENTLLPAHAQTSQVTPGSPLGTFTSGMVTVQAPGDNAFSRLAEDELSDELLEFFLPAATAQTVYCPNVACQVSISMSVFDTGSANLCFDASGLCTSTAPVNLAGSPAMLGAMGGSCHGLVVTGGEFQDPDWLLDVINTNDSNASTQVTLSPGGLVCID